MTVHADGARSDWPIYKRLFLQARPYWPHLAGILLWGLLATPLALLAPLPLKIVVDSVLGSRPLPGFLTALLPQNMERSPEVLLVLAASLVILTALASQIQALGGWLLQTYAGEKLLLEFRAELFRNAQRLSFSYHDTRGTADSTYRIQYDSLAIQHVIMSGVIPLISSLAMLASMIYVTARIDSGLVLIALSVSPVLFLLTRLFGRRLKRHWTDLKMMESMANAIVQEVLSSMRVVKAFGREDHEHGRFLGQATRVMKLQINTYMIQGVYDLLIALSLAVGTAAVLFVGASHVRQGKLTIGDLLLVAGYVALLFDPLRVLSKKLTELKGGVASAERAFALLNEVPDVVERSDARSLHRAVGHVSFRDVSFGYKQGSDVLKGVSLDVQAGSRVGIQGSTGAGKSTLLSLLVRFYDVTAGEILLDGVDVRDYKLNELRNQFGIVLQDAVLFSSSIAENIAYGAPGAAQEEIVEAARLANAHQFIELLPEGYATEVGERGLQLSGGERQRISLARAFLKDAPILILDEPTSAVDNATEGLIMDAMERLMAGRTTFMIAHRLSTLRNCDRRVEMRFGQLIDLELAAAGEGGDSRTPFTLGSATHG